MLSEKYISLPGVERIAKLEPAVLRNLQITQSYHVLSASMSQRIGRCANWCTFAAWASKQAGQTIRREDLMRAFEWEFAKSPGIQSLIGEIATLMQQKSGDMKNLKISKKVWELLHPAAIMQRSSEAVARGNQKVYAEIGREFARFIAASFNDETYTAENIARFCEALKTGEPPAGQQYLRQAFSHYYTAIFEADAKVKSEHIFLANLLIGFHEQTRLQPEIAEALNASVAVEPYYLKHRLLRALFPNWGWVHVIGSLFTRLTGRKTPLDLAITRFLEQVKHIIRHFLTERLMVLYFPNDVRLRLGDDLSSGIPANLKQLNNEDLLALLSKIDPTPNSLKETGAEDWASLPDRLHFIADMFRCQHENADLLMPPFNVEQEEAILNDRVPQNGRL